MKLLRFDGYWARRRRLRRHLVWRNEPSVAADAVEPGEADLAFSFAPEGRHQSGDGQVYPNAETAVSVRRLINLAIARLWHRIPTTYRSIFLRRTDTTAGRGRTGSWPSSRSVLTCTALGS